MRIRLPRLQRDKRFRLFIADADDAPLDRWFGSLKAALRAFDQLDERWKRHAWIIEYQEEPRFGGIPVPATSSTCGTANSPATRDPIPRATERIPARRGRKAEKRGDGGRRWN